MRLHEIQIGGNICWVCGLPIEDKDMSDHHGIPKCLKPAFNITIPAHRKCHEKINALYANQQKKNPPATKKIKVLLNQVEGITGTIQRTEKKLTRVCENIKKELNGETQKPSCAPVENSIKTSS